MDFLSGNPNNGNYHKHECFLVKDMNVFFIPFFWGLFSHLWEIYKPFMVLKQKPLMFPIVFVFNRHHSIYRSFVDIA